MICLKPKDVLQVLNRVSKRVDKSHLMLSLAAGIQIKQIEQVYKQSTLKKSFLNLLIFSYLKKTKKKCLPKEARVIRIMTNLPALVQEGCSVYSKGKNATEGIYI